ERRDSAVFSPQEAVRHKVCVKERTRDRSGRVDAGRAGAVDGARGIERRDSPLEEIRAIGIARNDQSAVLRNFVELKAGQLDRAITDFSQALNIDSNMTVALRERGLAYRLRGDLDAARADLSLFLRLQPNDEEVALQT